MKFSKISCVKFSKICSSWYQAFMCYTYVALKQSEKGTTISLKAFNKILEHFDKIDVYRIEKSIRCYVIGHFCFPVEIPKCNGVLCMIYALMM